MSAFRRAAASRDRSQAPQAEVAETNTSAPVFSRTRLASRGPSLLSPSGSWISNLRAPLPVISATSLSSSRSYMDMLKPEGSLGGASVRYKRPEFAHKFQTFAGPSYTSVKPVFIGGRLSLQRTPPPSVAKSSIPYRWQDSWIPRSDRVARFWQQF